MKINGLSLNILKVLIRRMIKKRRKSYPPHSFREWVNVYYTDKKNDHLAYDIYLANEDNRKHRCVIDIHGGAYILGEHKDNYPFGYELLKVGYDVILLDYIPNNGKRDISDAINELISSLNHIRNRLNEYDLSNDDFVIAGDSAGGHLALLLAELYSNKDIAKDLNLQLPDFNIVGVVANSPMYNYHLAGDDVLSSSGKKRMLGPKYKDKEHLKKYSPSTYINELKYPLFLSTCKNDFIRNETLMLKNDLENKIKLVYVDIDSDNKEVDHVHNVTKPHLEESKEVNEAIIKFLGDIK